VSDFLTVLDAELRLLQDQDRLAQSETATATALAALYKALGGGWEPNIELGKADNANQDREQTGK
jgi:multidrug efflux system outer membrane protein